MPGFLTQQTTVSPLAITDTFVVGSQAEMLALANASVGDIAIRTDLNQTFILKNGVSSAIENWQEILSPTSQYRGVSFTSSPYNLVAADSGKLLAAGNNSPSDITVTIPPQSTVPWQNGVRISVARMGTGGVLITEGVGVTIHSVSGLNINVQYGFVDLYRIEEDVWLARGDLSF